MVYFRHSILLAVSILVGLVGCDMPSGDDAKTKAQGISVVAHSDLGGAGLNGPVATVGRTAIVAAGITPGAGLHTNFFNPYPCPAVGVKIVNLTDPASPVVAATIQGEEGVAALDVDAIAVENEHFVGDLAAVALARCSAAGNNVHRGVAYYDITDPAEPVFLGRYMADLDSLESADGKVCGAAPDGDPSRCASSQHSVHLVERSDGVILSLSTEPAASASSFPSGDLRVVDVTDPRNPVEVGSYPGPGEPVFSVNGCRPFIGGHDATTTADGMTGLVAFFDGGLVTVDLSDPSSPVEHSRLGYADSREVEGNAGYVTSMSTGGRSYAFVSEDDWIGVSSRLLVETPDGEEHSYFGCPAMFTLFSSGDSIQVYRQPDARIEAEVAYVGRGCPANEGWGTNEPDPYLNDPRGKIALIDRMRQETQPELSAGSGCSLVERVKRAQSEGALAAVLMQTSENAPEAFSPDGDVDYVLIPYMMIDRPSGNELRNLVCGDVADDGSCVAETTLTGALVDSTGEFGGLRVIDITNPAQPVDVTTFRPDGASQFPPETHAINAPQHVETKDGIIYAAWNSMGLRILSVEDGSVEEQGYYRPADADDPTGTIPNKAYVVGVALVDGGEDGTNYILVTDINGGLYVLSRHVDA